jgi:hypothetical protein
MEEESNRVIRNLEKQRDATNQQRRENLQAMRENSAYEMRARERNQQIVQANLKSEQLSIQAEQKTKLQQADANAKAIESTVKSLVDFSVTAGKVAAERTKKMIEDQTAEGAQFRRQEYLNSPELKNNFAIAESQIPVQTEQLDATLMRDGALGFDSPLETAKGLASNPGRGYYWKKGYYNELIIEQTPLLVNRALQSTEEAFTDQAGNKFSGIEAQSDPDKMRIVLGQVQNALYGSTGLNINDLEPGFLERSNKFVDDFTSTSIRRSAAVATDRVYTGLTQQAEDLRTSGQLDMAFRLDVKNPKVGTKGALDNYFKLYSAQNADGSFRHSIEELDAQILTSSGKTVLEERGNSQRYQNALTARRKAQEDYKRVERNNAKLAAKDFADSAVPQMQEYFENADAQGDLAGAATFEREFYERFPNGSLPSGYLRAKKAALKENYDAEVAAIQTRAKTQTLDKEFVDAIENPKLQLAAIKALKEQETAKYGPKYAAMQKSLVSEAKTLTKFDPTVEGPGSGTTIMVTNALKNEYKYFFKALVDKGVPVDAAADQAYAQLTDYVAKGATDKTNKFYTETGALNKPTFPNIQGTTQALSTSSQEQRNELNKLILKNNANVGSIFSIPNAVLSETQIETTINSYYADNGTFKIPVNIQYASKLAGINPIAAINAQIQASNEKYGTNRKLITPSPAEEAIFDQVPSVQKLFTDFDRMSETRLFRGAAHITRTAGPLRASMTGTGVAPVEQTNALVEVAGELGVSPIDLATIIGFETGGTYDPGIVGGEGGNYRGLIQFGGPERAAYGVVPGMSFEEQLRGPVKRYFQDRFAKAGMSTQGATLEDLYTTVLAGNPGANRDARDSFGTSARSGVAKMGPHRERAMQRFGFSQN